MNQRRLFDLNPYFPFDVMDSYKSLSESFINTLNALVYETTVRPAAAASRFAATVNANFHSWFSDRLNDTTEYFLRCMETLGAPEAVTVPAEHCTEGIKAISGIKADAASGLEDVVDRCWQLPENTCTFVNEATRKPEQVYLTLPNEVAWKDRHMNLLELNLEESSNAKDVPIIFLTPVQRDPTLIDYESLARPRKSLARSALMSGFGPAYVSDYINAHPGINDDGWEEYLETSHEAVKFVAEKHGVKPVVVSVCQNVYMTALMLGRYPDAADVHLAIAGPWDMHAGDPFIVKMVEGIPVDYNRSVIRANGGMGRGDVINSLWLTARDEDRFNELYGRYKTLYNQIFSGEFDSQRSRYFRDWLFTTARDVPGKLMDDLFQFFKLNLTGDNRLGIDIAEYKGALGIVAADPVKDWITPRESALALGQVVGTPEDRYREFLLDGVGHHGSYSSAKVIEPVYEAKIFPWIHSQR